MADDWIGSVRDFWTAVLKEYDLETKASLLRILLKKIEGITCARRPRTTF